MTEGTFEKISGSDKPMYGPRKILFCGFSKEAQANLVTVLGLADMAAVETVWVLEEQDQNLLSDLLSLPDRTGWGKPSSLPRAVIVSGITQKELMGLMTVCRKTGMKDSLWAALTPTSETWPLRRLLSELAAERDALLEKKS